jgi:hypothetical protein
MADTTVGLMAEVVGPLGAYLTTLDAGPSHPGFTAGPAFRLSRAAGGPTHQESARVVFRERLTELAAYCRLIEARGAQPVLLTVRSALLKYAAIFE